MKTMYDLIMQQQLRLDNFISAQQLGLKFDLTDYHARLKKVQKTETRFLKKLFKKAA